MAISIGEARIFRPELAGTSYENLLADIAGGLCPKTYTNNFPFRFPGAHEGLIGYENYDETQQARDLATEIGLQKPPFDSKHFLELLKKGDDAVHDMAFPVYRGMIRRCYAVGDLIS